MRFLKRWLIVGIILSIILFFVIQIIPPEWMWGADEDPLSYAWLADFSLAFSGLWMTLVKEICKF